MAFLLQVCSTAIEDSDVSSTILVNSHLTLTHVYFKHTSALNAQLVHVSYDRHFITAHEEAHYVHVPMMA